MAESRIERIRPGVVVECTDGRLGTVDSIEHDESGQPAFLKVARGWATQRLLVPFDLVTEVSEDGAVHLSCAKAEIERLAGPSGAASTAPARQEPLRAEAAEVDRTLELKEEQLVPRKELREVGQVRIRKEVEDVPRRLEADARREEAIVEHVPVSQVVQEQVPPWEEDGVMVVPVYEEQLVLVKRLVLKEQIRIRREATTETRVFEESVRRERLVIEDPGNTGLVREHYPTAQVEGERVGGDEPESEPEEGGFLEKLGRKVLE